MSDTGKEMSDETEAVSAATAVLARYQVPVNAREFRLRQEFFRYGWDVRVRDAGGVWTVRAVKPGRPEVAADGSTEGTALRLALAMAIGFDEADASD